MQIIRLSPTGIDTVTFWANAEKPGGCLIQFDNHPLVYAVAAVTRKPGDKPEVGLMEIDPRLHHYVVNELQGRTLVDHDIDFVSDTQQVFALCRKGGLADADPETAAAMTALETRMGEEGVGQKIREALIANQR